MMKKLSSWFIKISNGWVTLTALVIFILFTAFVLSGQASSAKTNTGVDQSPDMSFLYSSNDLYLMAQNYGPQGRSAYIKVRFTFDLVWPIVYTFFLLTAISWIYHRSFKPGSLWRLANLVPVLGILFDYLENISTSIVMARYPSPTIIVAQLAPILTLLKWVFVGGSFVLIVLGLAIRIWGWVKIKLGNKVFTTAFLLLTASLLGACSTFTNASNSLLLPVGRSSVIGGNNFQILIDAEPYHPKETYDDYGGYWVEIPYDPLVNSEILLQITINQEQPGLYKEESNDLERWLNPSKLIDSDNSKLIEEAEMLAVDKETAVEKARSIQEFVIRHLEFKIYRNHFLYSASDSYERGYGTCVNYARLFVALCRVANIPARTVWGIIYGDGEYDYHHEWAEFMDEKGYWHPLDLTFTTAFTLSDIRYLDLIYSSEENPLYERSRNEEYSDGMTQFVVYDTTDQPFDGRMGFKLVENNSPVSYVVENTFILADIPSMIPQRVP
jgi:hypothetical protein